MRVLDLFCGAAGGWSLGMHRAGYTTVAACEFDPARRAAFSHNNPNVRMFDDVRSLTAARIVGALGYFPEVVVGSPPCQDASTANPNGKGIDGERTGLFKDFVRIVGEGRPNWVAAENVPGLRARGADWVLNAFQAIGYACWPLVVGAEHAGAPHERKRVWFIATDTEKIGRGARRPGRSAVSAQRAQHEGRQADARDADETGLAQWQSERSDHDAQLSTVERTTSQIVDADQDQRRGIASDEEIARHCAALERATGARGIRWHGGPSSHMRMDDGLSAELARQCIAAYGDAVLPQITEAIGHAIRRTESLIAEGSE